jgi:hypothetical protein
LSTGNDPARFSARTEQAAASGAEGVEMAQQHAPFLGVLCLIQPNGRMASDRRDGASRAGSRPGPRAAWIAAGKLCQAVIGIACAAGIVCARVGKRPAAPGELSSEIFREERSIRSGSPGAGRRSTSVLHIAPPPDTGRAES